MTIETRTISRRKVLAGVGVGAATLGVASLPALTLDFTSTDSGNWWQGSGFSLATSTADQWAAQIGTVFTAAGRGSASLKLVAVQRGESAGSRPRGVARSQSFVAVFDSLDRVAPAGDTIFALSHDVFGALSIHVGPSAGGTSDRRMEAVFN
jgi:hypothetical protein